MIETLGSPWIPVALLTSLALIARFLQGSYLAPSAFVGLLWSLYLVVPLLVLSDTISSRSIWAIVGLIGAAQVGAFLTEQPGARRRNGGDPLETNALGERLLKVSLVCTLLSLVGSSYFVLSSIRYFQLSFSLEGFLSLGSLFYGLADQGEFESTLVRALMIWVFPAALLGGMATGLLKKRKKKLFGFSAFLPAILFGAAVAMRMGLLIATCCWIAGYLAVRAYLNQENPLQGRKLIVTVAVALVSIAGLYVALDIVRGKEYSALEDLFQRLGANFFGYLVAFDDWWKTSQSHSLNLGSYTFAGAFELMGLKERLRGLYTEQVMLNNGVLTNIYTALRGVIEDFSFLGAAILFMFFGAAAGNAYSALRRGQARGFLVLAGYYAFFAWSPIVSVFNYNGVLAAWAVGFAVLSTVQRPRDILENNGPSGQLSQSASALPLRRLVRGEKH